jgi:hypothetical protein
MLETAIEIDTDLPFFVFWYIAVAVVVVLVSVG